MWEFVCYQTSARRMTTMMGLLNPHFDSYEFILSPQIFQDFVSIRCTDSLHWMMFGMWDLAFKAKWIPNLDAKHRNRPLITSPRIRILTAVSAEALFHEFLISPVMPTSTYGGRGFKLRLLLRDWKHFAHPVGQSQRCTFEMKFWPGISILTFSEVYWAPTIGGY